MVKILKGNIAKCPDCNSFLKYDDSDITTEERCCVVGTYYGETYNAKLITCPRCGKEIEVY